MSLLNNFGSPRFNPDPKKEKVMKEKKPFKHVKKATGEAIVFQMIWDTRPHKSFISDALIREGKASNFLHVLPKGKNKYPEFKLLKKNIVLGTDEEHFIWDNARHLINPNDKGWQKMFALEEELISDYKLKINI